MGNEPDAAAPALAPGKRAALAFSAPELLAIFPAPLPDPDAPRLAADDEAADPALQIREAAPLSKDAFFALLKNHGAARWAAALHLWFRPFFARFAAMTVPIMLLTAAMTAPLWLFNGTQLLFSARSLAIATTVQAAYSGLLIPGLVFTTWSARGIAGVHRTRVNEDFSGHVYGGVARWAQLCAEGRSRLIQHDGGDPLCPCSSPSCALRSADTAAMTALFLNSVFSCFESFVFFAQTWTATVTFAPRTFASPWSTVLAVFNIAAISIYQLVRIPADLVQNPPLDLAKRIRHRAVLMLMQDVVARRDSLSLPASTEPYVAFHYSLSTAWASNLARFHGGSGFVLFVAGFCLANCIVMAAADGCIPLAWPLLLLEVLASSTLRMIFLTASWNAGISSIRALYSSAATQLLKRETDPALGSPARTHAELLRAFAADDMRGKWLGIPVDYSVARTVAVTGVTVVLGLWTVVRGAGVVFTIQNVCGGIPVD
ncbi:hypothetical protein DFJ74DRAFT_418073 [Hyaloraphidium curvatum]|nr:hypothetical protein DFJ74DRAFT_418073 [Hyaloraphidium curvatum]